MQTSLLEGPRVFRGNGLISVALVVMVISESMNYEQLGPANFSL